MSVLIDVLGLLGTGSLIAYMLFVRSKRSEVMAKFKVGTPEHRLYKKLMDARRLAGAVILFLVFLGDLVWMIIKTPADAGYSPSFITIVFFATIVVVSIIVYIQMRSKKSPS